MPKFTRQEISDLLKERVAKELGVDEDIITDESNFQKDLDADSLDLVEMIMSLEDDFGIKISDDDARTLETFGQAVDYILGREPDKPEASGDSAPA